MPLTKSYIVYMHTNKANGKVYVGITRQKPERRWQNGAGYARTYFGNAISKYAHIHQQKRTVVIDVDGKEYTFDSIKAAADYFGVRANTATSYASGVRHDPSGRGWSICL